MRNRAQLPLPVAAAAALVAPEIPASKLGASRHARLSRPERELYFSILRRFATAGRPSRSEMSALARQVGLEDAQALDTLAREDLFHLGGDGEISVASPFSGLPTAHRVRFPNGHEVFAMCAIDALGIAPILGKRIEIASCDPLTSEEIQVALEPGGEGHWQPEKAVLVCGASGGGESCSSCCPVLNFFASMDNATSWLPSHADVRGDVISMGEAIAGGRVVFGDVLKEV
jgi:hypothetical protein